LLSLDPKKLANKSIPVGAGWLLGSCMEARGKQDLWWNYFLGLLRQAYKELERQVESVEARPAKSDLVRQSVLGQVEQFTLGDLAAQMPAVSPQLIKKVFAELKKQGRIRLAGRGRGARWEIVS
jgi:hypothetical protein